MRPTKKQIAVYCGTQPTRGERRIERAENMKSDFLEKQTKGQKQTTRREVLRDSAMLAGSAFLAQLFPGTLMRASAAVSGQQGTAPAADRVATVRAQMGAAPIQAQKLADNLSLLSGPGGNVVVLSGPDGKLVGDTFF